jgi:hypothetical protein
MKHVDFPVPAPAGRTYVFPASLLLAGALLIAQPATAALISTSASIDWSTFSVTPIDTGSGLPSLSWKSQSDTSSLSSGCSWYGCNAISDSASNWAMGTSVVSSTSTSKLNTSASAQTSVGLVKSSIEFNPVSPTSSSWSASDNGNRSGNFTVHGDGVLLFKANYNIAATAASGASESSNANMNAGFSLNAYGTDSSASSNQSANRSLYSGQSPLTENGMLSVALLFHDGWTGNFSATTSNSLNYYGYGGGGTVPLPSACWVFVGALGGMAAFVRRPGRGTAGAVRSSFLIA